MSFNFCYTDAMTTNTILSADNLTAGQTEQVAKLIELKAQIAALEADYKAVSEDFIANVGAGQYILDGKGKVIVTSATKRSIDVDQAKALLKPALFRSVTETKVSLSLWDAAAKLNQLPENASDIVTETVGDLFVKVTVSK